MKLLLIILIFFSNLFLYAHDERSFSLKANTFLWKTNWDKHSIDYDELLSGGPSRDGIPPIDNPKFVNIKEAKEFLRDSEPLIFVEIKGKRKAYPLQILIWHEIVNDTLGNTPIAVTFCPLCNAFIVFDRRLDKKLYDFGTSGLLRNSDLVMYDRQTESLWQQFTGTAIIGDMLDSKLKEINSSIVSFKDIYTNYKNVKILSRETGYKRSYGSNPYVGYDDINQSPFLYQGSIDKRLPPMRRVATVSLNGKDKAYSYKDLEKVKVVNDKFENKNLALFFTKKVNSALDKGQIARSNFSGSVLIYDRNYKGQALDFYYKNGFYDRQTNSKWNIFGEAIEGELKGAKLTPIVHGSHFWFAWVVFKPNTIVYNK